MAAEEIPAYYDPHFGISMENKNEVDSWYNGITATNYNDSLFNDSLLTLHFDSNLKCLQCKDYAIYKASQKGFIFTHICCSGKGICFEKENASTLITAEDIMDVEAIENFVANTLSEAVDNAIASTIPTTLIPVTPGVNYDEKIYCSICHTHTTDNRKLECGHIFCSTDITRWFSEYHTTCPLCRHQH